MGRGKETCPFPYLKEESLKEIEFELAEGKIVKLQYEDNCQTSTQNVFDGEYDVDISFTGGPVILDIGANIGAFTIWALKRFNPSDIYCYEPLKRHFNLLQQNIKSLPETPTKITLINKAIEAPSNKLYLGKKSTASSSFYNLQGQLEEYEEVENMSAKELPECSLLKVDTEGCEINIITKYLYTHNRPVLILFEFHREEDRVELDKLLTSFNYKLCGGFVFGVGLGVFKYVTPSAIRMVYVE